MKKIIVSLIALLCVNISGVAQDLFIYGEDSKKIYFRKTDSIVQIQFKDNANDEEKMRIVKNINSKHEVQPSKSNCFIVVRDKNLQLNYSQMANEKSIVYANQSLLSVEGDVQIPTNKILAKIKNGLEIEPIIAKLKIPVKNYRRIGHNPRSYLIVLTDGESVSAANKLYESGYFEYAQPSFTRFIKPLNAHYSNQWGLNNTGQYGGAAGTDIKAVNAWSITTGSNNISVAVIDQGVDLDHPDLDANLLPGHDATDGGLGGVNGDCWNPDAHGTACAGIIAAIDNTSGTKGVAPNCRIVPIRVTYSLPISNNYRVQIWDDDWMIDAVNHAWEVAGVDVLSCSWRVDANIPGLTSEIHDAVTQGRNGNGCVVVFSAGNDNASSVSYPASLANVIAVGAISQCGTRKRSSSNSNQVNQGVQTDPLGVSCDGETWWGSNYGSALDVVAPGVQIYTTDIQGDAGYNTSSGTVGDYYSSFSGTSAACPHVSGIAALILSVRPDLTQAQVRQAIESTCTKLPNYSFSNNAGHPNGTWHSEVGHGLVNAYAALQAVIPAISGPDFRCPNSTATYTVSNKPSNATVTWSSSMTLTSANNTTGNSATFNYGAHSNSQYIYDNTGRPATYYNKYVSAVVHLADGTDVNTPVKYVAEPDLTRGVYTQYGIPSATNRLWSISNPYVPDPDYRLITVNLFSDPGITYSWSMANLTNNVSSSVPSLNASNNGRTVEFLHSFANTYALTVNATYCGASHSNTTEFYPFVNDAGGVDCMMGYNPGTGTVEVSFTDVSTAKSQQTVKSQQTYLIRLYDFYGHKVREGSSSGETVTWNVSDLPGGVYIISVTDDKNRLYDKKFLLGN